MATGLSSLVHGHCISKKRVILRPHSRSFPHPTLTACRIQSSSGSDGSLASDLQELAGLLKRERSDFEYADDIDLMEGGSPDITKDEDEMYDPERAYLVGMRRKRDNLYRIYGYGVLESLKELECLAEAAGLQVVGQTHQNLEHPCPATFIGEGKVKEVAKDADQLEVETVVFDEELSPVQLKNLDGSMGEARVCDRTALTLDIFSQRARTKEGKLQVELAQVEYQLPRLTRMWSHLERQVGGSGSKGAVKGMGEKQIEVDKRLLRRRIASIKQQLEDVRNHRKHARDKRAKNNMPVIALAGYTNAGKSTLLNRLTQSDVLVEDKLFATLDPTTRRLELPSGKEALLSDTVGFIQKLPTHLVAAFRATLEEMQDATLILHVVDISHENADVQADAVLKVLEDIGASKVPMLTVWNKMDRCLEPEIVRKLAKRRENVICMSSATGDGIEELLTAIETALKDSMLPMKICLPFSCGELVDLVHKHGIVKQLMYCEDGAVIEASIPLFLVGRLRKYRTQSVLESLDA